MAGNIDSPLFYSWAYKNVLQWRPIVSHDWEKPRLSQIRAAERRSTQRAATFWSRPATVAVSRRHNRQTTINEFPASSPLRSPQTKSQPHSRPDATRRRASEADACDRRKPGPHQKVVTSAGTEIRHFATLEYLNTTTLPVLDWNGNGQNERGVK